jgi:membrane peptidoglycan carboxypeptidase
MEDGHSMNSNWQDSSFEREDEERDLPIQRPAVGLPRLRGGIRRHRRLIGTVAAILLPVLVLGTVLYTWLQPPPANPGGNAGSPTSTRIYDRNHVLLWQMGPDGSSSAQKRAPHFVDYVVNQLAMLLTDDGTRERGMQILQQSGLQIYTTIDVRLEDYIEQDVHHYLTQPYTIDYDFEHGTFPPLSAPQSQGGYNIHDAAVVVIDPRTGDILAMDGSNDYYSQGNIREGGAFNAATSPVQAGAVFMPLVYAAAFEEGWFPSLVLRDQLTCFPIQVDPSIQPPQSRTCGQWYAPINYGGTYLTDARANPPTLARGIRIRNALGDALNIPAVQTLYFAGVDNVITLAERMGITSANFAPNAAGPSLALGSAGVSLLDMVNAYATFANSGKYLLPRSILRVTDAQGHVLAGSGSQTSGAAQVLSPQTAFLITNILADNTARSRELGANNALSFSNLPAAAMTAITADFKDTMTVGYTPSLAVGVWAGNANGDSMSPNTLPMTGAPLWHDVLGYAAQLLKTRDTSWAVPPGVSQQRVDGATGLPSQQGNYTDWFNNAEVPDLP